MKFTSSFVSPRVSTFHFPQSVSIQMAGTRRKTALTSRKTVGDKNAAVKDDCVFFLDESSSESEVKKLRGQWELASVLNFLNVFEPVIGNDLKLTAEEIERGLIAPNKSNAQLHIILLKGIPPVSKLLNGSDAWVTVLCKKLAMWWPWVAEGQIPLTAAKGQEISRYKELDPTSRLLILKALCEIRADQDDTVSYINDALKSGTQVSSFRKDNIGKDGKGTSYWYDGNTIIGYRLYTEVIQGGSKTRMKGKTCLTLPPTCIQWKTVATNFEEFCVVADELSSSKVGAEVALGKTIVNDAVPVVEKFHKKKQRSLKRKQREKMLLLDGFGNPYVAGVTRSCRSRRPISYTFDEYDRAIDEAIALTKKSKNTKELRIERKHIKQEKNASDGIGASLEESFGEKGDSEGSDTESGRLQEAGNSNNEDNEDDSGKKGDTLQEAGSNDDEDNEDDYGQKVDSSDDDNSSEDDYSKKDDENAYASDSGNSNEERDNLVKRKNATTFPNQKPAGSHWSQRLAEGSSHHVIETKNLSAKNRLRQRPIHNSALDSVVFNSEDKKSAEHTNSGISGCENSYIVADSEEVGDS